MNRIFYPSLLHAVFAFVRLLYSLIMQKLVIESILFSICNTGFPDQVFSAYS